MAEENLGDIRGGFLSKFKQIHTPKTITTFDDDTTSNKINYSWTEIIFPVTLITVSFISIIFIFLIFWFKYSPKKYTAKMNSEINNLEESMELTEEPKLVFNFKDRLDQCNEFESFSDENHSPNIEKFKYDNKSMKSEMSSSKFYDAPNTSDSKKQYIPHSAPPLEIKHEVSLLPPKESSSAFKCTTPSIFKFELKSVSPIETNKEKNTNIFNFSLNSPFSSDSVAYYTPKTSCINEDSPESSRSDLLNTPSSSSFYTTTPNSKEIQESIEDRAFNSPKSCEYFSAKSTTKNSHEYFKFPDPNLSETYDTSSYIRTKTNENTSKGEVDVGNVISTDSLNIEASAIMHRRARLKSISLDSESANLVEAHLSVPMINLIRTQEFTPQNDTNVDNDCDTSSSSKKFRNLKSLTLNLDYKDETLQDTNKHEEEIPKTPKTPTLTQSKQKAISLDSSDAFTPLVKLPRGSASIQNSSASVPNTPKRFLKKVMHKPSNLIKSSYYTCFSDSLNMSGIVECLPSSRSYSQRLIHHNSFRSKVNLDENSSTNKISDSQNHLGASNLHLLKTSLSVSNNNLKTLPEVMPLSDFNEPSHSLMQERLVDAPEAHDRKSILQRRGSNQSLTINLDSNLRSSQCLSLQGSVSNLFKCHALSASNYSIYEHATNNPKKSKCLLQRRVSNQNLAHLNLNNRFSSQSLLGINNSSSSKKGLLERRNSNTSLTLNLSTSFQGVFSHCVTDTIPSNEPVPCSPCSLPDYHSSHRHRKSLSTECLLENNEATGTYTQHSARDLFGSADCVSSGDGSFRTLRQKGASSGFDGPLRLITTRPLSPQADSEDFRMHLANLETLRSASNVLCRKQLKELQIIFERGYQANKDGKEESYKREAPLRVVNKGAPDKIIKSAVENNSTLNKSEFTMQHKDEDRENKSCDKNITALSNIDKFFSTSAGLASNNLEHHKKMLLLSLHREFWSLPNNFQDKSKVYGSQNRNRYKSILPNEHTRVVLDEKTSCNSEGYINANYIKGYDNLTEAYIVTQGPLSNTIYDFWSMVYQNVSRFIKGTQERNIAKHTRNISTSSQNKIHYQKIVMLTPLAESNYQKCSPYFPTHNGESMKFSFDGNSYVLGDNSSINSNTIDNSGNFSVYEVMNTGVLFKQGYSLRRLFVKRKNNLDFENQINRQDPDTIEVFHYWFEGWPDHKSPDDVHVLLDMCLHILDADCASEFSSTDYVVFSEQSCKKTVDYKTDSAELTSKSVVASSPASPLPIIHCSAGIGRTGCLVAVLNGVRQLRDTQQVDILGIVSTMRLARGGMVQNSEQYELIHRALCAYEQQISQEENVIK